MIRQSSEQVYANKRKSYTRNQIILGGIPIFVDEEFRDRVIPKATQHVETFYSILSAIDGYEKKEEGGNQNKLS